MGRTSSAYLPSIAEWKVNCVKEGVLDHKKSESGRRIPPLQYFLGKVQKPSVGLELEEALVIRSADLVWWIFVWVFSKNLCNQWKIGWVFAVSILVILQHFIPRNNRDALLSEALEYAPKLYNNSSLSFQVLNDDIY